MTEEEHEIAEEEQRETEEHIEALTEEREEKHELEHELEQERHAHEHERLETEVWNHDHGYGERLDRIEEALGALTVGQIEHEQELSEHAEVIDNHAEVLEEVAEGEPVEGAEGETEASEAGGGNEAMQVEEGVLTVVPSEKPEEPREIKRTSHHWGR